VKSGSIEEREAELDLQLKAAALRREEASREWYRLRGEQDALAEEKRLAEGRPRTCNKHDDCDAADARWPGAMHLHCHADDCEECFGS
jgi:hypothetical protein